MIRTIATLAALAMLAIGPASAQGIKGEPAVGPMMPADKASAKPGEPADHLPDGTRLISSFGERPAFSPDGSRLAFIGASYGDAFEYDLATGRTRNLTAHAPHQGFLRIQYLPDGSYLLLGPHQLGKTREETRFGKIELWWMDKEAARPPVRLKIHVHEGIAVSSETNRVAWTEPNPKGVTRALDMKGATLFTGDIVVAGGTARLANVREITSEFGDCVVEAQDFLPGDKGLLLPCYHRGTAIDTGVKPAAGTTPATNNFNPLTDVLSIDFTSKKLTTYPTPRNLYGEVEGIFPDGRRALVECTSDRTAGMDLCVLELKTDKPRYTRLTRIMDWGRWKYGNPVVRKDSRQIAAQIGPADVIDAGVGEGIVLIDLPAGY
jgi:hypothetical protein